MIVNVISDVVLDVPIRVELNRVNEFFVNGDITEADTDRVLEYINGRVSGEQYRLLACDYYKKCPDSVVIAPFLGYRVNERIDITGRMTGEDFDKLLRDKARAFSDRIYDPARDEDINDMITGSTVDYTIISKGGFKYEFGDSKDILDNFEGFKIQLFNREKVREER